ncbi:MAG: putative toxin-antitoxin system toxin component, PIN family [Chitinophagaceae bacterium]|nr:putative toxin-antitoxin system toxin component, PIN family [Chitinophagaceae bacterium]
MNENNPLKVVLDTNALLRTISRHSIHKNVLDKLFNKQFDLFVTTEILFEYEEKIGQIFTYQTAGLIIGALSLLSNIKKTSIYFKLNLISFDQDDNKFVDCAFAANANFLVTDDKHYNILKSVNFPKINILSLAEFSALLETKNS